ncbi:MAG: DMT family transporter [Promethearchaeota archaeon]
MREKLKKGILFGTIGVIFVGLQPIIANSRPEVLDAHIFAAMTCLVESLIFLPVMMIESRVKQKNLKILNNSSQNNFEKFSVAKNIKKNTLVLIFIGVIFGLNQLLFFLGYKLAGAINGALTQKTTVFFGILFGYILLKEKITKRQLIFSILLFFGLYIAITQGSLSFFNFKIETLIGVLLLLIISCLWMLGHTLTKKIFTRNEITPTQMVFLRNLIGGLLLFLTYFTYNPVENLLLFANLTNNLFFLAMGAVYGIGLWFWYKTLSILNVSRATTIFSPTPLITAIFATMILNEVFTIFHLIGTMIVILSIIIIMHQQEQIRQ